MIMMANGDGTATEEYQEGYKDRRLDYTDASSIVSRWALLHYYSGARDETSHFALFQISKQ